MHRMQPSWVRYFLPSTILRYEHELDCARETIAVLQKEGDTAAGVMSIYRGEAQKHIDHLEREKANQPTQWELVAWMVLALSGDEPTDITADLNSAFPEMRTVGQPNS